MKKTLKGLYSAIISTFVAVSAAAAAMPAYADYTVTIDKTAVTNDNASHIYEAYQVFSGTLNGTGESAVLSDINWGSGVNGSDILAALQASSNFGTPNTFASCDSAAAVAEVIDEWEDDSAYLQKFADIVGANLKAATVTGTLGNPDISIPDAGYYFIKDKNDSLESTENKNKQGAYTDYILKVVDSVTIKAKEDVPTIEKKIVEGNELVEANTASIGDVITFQLDSKVPDMSAYDKYFFVINDTLCEGLSFSKDSANVKVYIDNALINSNNYEVQTGDAADGYSFQIVMNNFKANYGNDKGKDIKVTYEATLNEKADRTNKGNLNTVNLTYSNNPNVTQTGENEPSGTDPKGKSPDSSTKTYTTGLLIKKIDGSTKDALTGAEFEIKGSGVNNVIVASVNDFVAAADGTFYKLKDGTYTDIAPTSDTENNYDNPTTKYKLNVTVKTHSESGDDSAVKAFVDDSGMVSFAGLGAGTYTITETTTPNGYNTISPITIEITANPTMESPGWTIKKNGEALTAPTGIYEFTVENNKGVTLPGTGGIGTTIFYVVGGLLMSGALVLLIVKKRMNVKEK